MAQIHVLDETTINKIAAGEVVERPASVVKELVENSIDAGASSIEIEIGDGGIAYMRITDNGCGMEEEDARLCVLRHATSKITKVDDLFDIASLGFRGEAIASIASVSEFKLVTRTLQNEMGTQITISGGHFEDCIPFGAKPGTTIEVKNLFFNTPARRKFLKTERTESSKIQEIISKLALSNPQIAFKCVVDEKVTIMTPGNGSLVDTVAALYGYKVSDDVFPVEYEGDGIHIHGIVSKPTVLKSSRQWQTVIVNNRVITDKAILKAIDNAYHALLPKGGHPLVVLHIVVPSESVDINVHPRKSEVKFSDDKIIYRAVYHAVLGALDKPLHQYNDITDAAVTSIDYDKVFSNRTKGYEVVQETPSFKDRHRAMEFVNRIRTEGYIAPTRLTYDQSTLQYQNEDFSDAMTNIVNQERQIDTLDVVSRRLDRISDRKDVDSKISNNFMLDTEKSIHGLISMGQVADCFILAKKENDLYIIDQHAAHERVRYDMLCKSAEGIPREDLLISRYIDASEDELLIAYEEQGTLLDLGFAVEQGGPSQLRIDSIPIDIVESKVEEVIRYVFSFLHDNRRPEKAQLRHEMLAYASCRGAIKAGHTLNDKQIYKLLDDLFKTDKPYVCPHGRPTIIKFTPDELGKLFLRS